jgi:drug/metabolite transporter (DMT)-like permease
MKVLLAWLFLCGVWSSTWIFIKLGLNDLPPISFAALRFLVSAVVLGLILAARHIQIPRTRKFWALAGATGLFQFFINYGLLFWGEQYISSGLAAVLQTTIPAFGLILAQIYLPDERITLLKAIGLILGTAGVAAIFYEQLKISGWLSLAGCAAVVVGAFFAAYASILTKAFGGNTNSSALLTVQMLFGLVPLTFIGLASEGNPFAFRWTLIAVFSVLYLALIGSVVAFWLYYWLLKNMEATKAMLIALVTPFIAVIIGNVSLGESLERQTLVGGVLILLSVALILFAPKRAARIQNLSEENVLKAQ